MKQRFIFQRNKLTELSIQSWQRNLALDQSQIFVSAECCGEKQVQSDGSIHVYFSKRLKNDEAVTALSNVF